MRSVALRSLRLIVAVAISATGLYAQGVASGPELTIELHQHDALVTGPLDVYVTFTNVGNVDLWIERAELIFPAAVASTRDRLPTNLLACGDSVAASMRDVPASSQLFFHCVFQRYDRNWYVQLFDISTLLFLPAKYRVQAIVEYSPIMSDSLAPEAGKPHRRFLRQQAEVDLKPPLLTLLRGSWLGCLLAALFITIRWTAGRSAPETDGGRRWLREMVPVLRFGSRVLLTGLVASTIIVLMLQRLSDIGLPLTIEVNDWVGGVIVGLIAFASTDALYRKLSGASDNSTTSDRVASAEASTP